MIPTGTRLSFIAKSEHGQEAFLVDRTFHPAPCAPEVLERLGSEAFTTELARFNLEMNLDPVPLHGPCFRVLLAEKVKEDPLQLLQDGEVPGLKALTFFNGTIYRWNRPCYGVMDGKPHLRIESRVLPSGPTVLDEVANGAFWTGLVLGVAEEVGDVTERMDFDEARSNFIDAARRGLNAGFEWFDGESVDAKTLILERLLPMAERSLKKAGVDEGDVSRYLGVIGERVETGQNGSVWTLRSAANLKDKGTRSERLAAFTATALRLQKEGNPVHEWELAELTEAGGWQKTFLRVGQYMNTDLFTVNEDELLELAAFLMDRKQIRHVAVEDHQHRLVGLVSEREFMPIAYQLLMEKLGQQ